MSVATLLTMGHTALRNWQESDLETLQALRNNVPLQLQLMTQPKHNSMRQVRAWLMRKSQDNDTVFFVIAENMNSAVQPVLGYIQVAAINRANRSGRLGICIAPDAQGKGHGAAAIALLELYVARETGLRKLMLEVLEDNLHARRLYAKLGYQQCGRLREHFFAHEKFHDVLLMEKLIAP